MKIDANFTEEIVGFALESFLTLVSFPRPRFSIEPFSRGRERWLGADARMHSAVRGFRPFYMQFKRPAAYPNTSTSKIIKNRKSLGLGVTERALFFGLRDKKPSHADFQHNILLRLRQRLVNRGIGDATYVCPLFLERSAYRFHVHWSGIRRWPQLWRRLPWDWEDVRVHDAARVIQFARIPVLAEHVSIPPHDVITHARHQYSFTEDGTEVCFHSPEVVPDGSQSFGSFLDKLSARFPEGEKIRRDDANDELRELLSTLDLFGAPDVPFRFGDDPIANWLEFGDWLQREHEIHQFAMVAWDR
jgi:hypothetical protein